MSKIYWILMIFCFSTSRIKFESLLRKLTSPSLLDDAMQLSQHLTFLSNDFHVCTHHQQQGFLIFHILDFFLTCNFLPHISSSFFRTHRIYSIALECSLRFCARSSLSSSCSLDLVTVPHSSQKLLLHPLLPPCSFPCIYDEGYICSRKIFSHIKVGNKFTLSLKILLWSFRTLVFSSFTASRWKSNNCMKWNGKTIQWESERESVHARRKFYCTHSWVKWKVFLHILILRQCLDADSWKYSPWTVSTLSHSNWCLIKFILFLMENEYACGMYEVLEKRDVLLLYYRILIQYFSYSISLHNYTTCLLQFTLPLTSGVKSV